MTARHQKRLEFRYLEYKGKWSKRFPQKRPLIHINKGRALKNQNIKGLE